jgi:acetylornithine deacetylase/succinyl-diaminopimelate desuccinylase-like protein
MREHLQRVVGHLASIDRRPASDGERRSAEWIAEELRAIGLEPGIEEERGTGGFWWQLAVLNGVAALAGARRSRFAQLVAGAASARGAWDELGVRRRWTRALMPKRPTWNVWAEAGDPGAERTLIVAAHHDAAPGGLFFDQTLPRTVASRFPGWLENARAWPRVLWWVPAGGALVALGGLLGSRRLSRIGAAMSAISAAGFADIGCRPTSPGANDNATSVAAALALGRRLTERPVEGLRVLLVFPGSEEAFEEGMLAFLDRHAAELPRDSTALVALEMLGAKTFLICEGEGPLMRIPYDAGLKDLLSAAAADVGVEALRDHWSAFQCDALAGIRRGYPSVMLISVDEHKLPPQYHSPHDLPEHIDFGTVEQAVLLVEAAVHRHAAAPTVAS